MIIISVADQGTSSFFPTFGRIKEKGQQEMLLSSVIDD